MKLTEIAIEGNTHTGHTQLGPFARGLNFVYGENGGGKSTFASFVSGLLSPSIVGLSAGSNEWFDASSLPGHATISSTRGAFRLSRTGRPSEAVQIQPLNHTDVTNASAIHQLAGDLDPALFEAAFHFSFRNTAERRLALAQVAHDLLGVPVGPAAADGTATVHAQRERQHEIDQLNAQLSTIEQSIDSLRATRHHIADQLHKIDTQNESHQQRLVDLDQRIEHFSNRLSNLNPTPLRSQLAIVEQDIRTVQARIDALTIEAQQPIAAPQPVVDNFRLLYEQLDQVEQQITRWRHVQNDVQHQRVRLKDEMLEWNEMTLESDRHPYHNAREILVGLESRVDQAEQTARRWSGTTASQIDVAQMAGAVEELCEQMRDDLYSLCEELANQYKHLRQRAAAAELKQLRNCYHEMGENTNRLLQRRNQVIADIRSVDPAGADAIVRSEQKFCECARHEGYLNARRRYLGDVAATTPAVAPQHPGVPEELASQRLRLQDLTYQHDELLNSLRLTEAEFDDLTQQESELVRERNRLQLDDTVDLRQQLLQLDTDLANQESQRRTLADQHAAASAQPTATAHPTLVHAGELLSELTTGELTQTFLTTTTPHTDRAIDWEIRDSQGRVRNFTGLDAAEQDQVYLAIALSMCQSLRAAGIEHPIMIDDAFLHIGPHRVDETLQTLHRFSQRYDQQILLLTQHRYLADRLPELPVFELPPPHSITQPLQSPQRSAPQVAPTTPRPRHEPVTQDLHSLASDYGSQLPPVSFTSTVAEPNSNRPYPLSKYSVDPEARGNLPPELDADYRLPWSPLNRTDSTRRTSSSQASSRDGQYRTSSHNRTSNESRSDRTQSSSRDNRAQTFPVRNYAQRQRMDHGDLGRSSRTESNRGEYQRSSRSRTERSSNGNREYTDRERSNRERSTRDHSNREYGPARPVALSPSDASESQLESRSTRTSRADSSRSSNTNRSSQSDTRLKFYLDLSDALEAAPSIGPKTAERFEKIGVLTVADFLRQTAESMATRLNYKRLSAEVLQTWQQQTRLVCRVPNLRGHDAQLLVACNVIDPEELSAMAPSALFDVIGPFSETKEGLKIIRSGKKPDLAEVTDWIAWAENMRSLQAA